MARAMDLLDRAIARIKALEISPTSTLSPAAAVVDPGADVAWSPAIPSGHSSYTWTGNPADHSDAQLPSPADHSDAQAPSPAEHSDAQVPSTNPASSQLGQTDADNNGTSTNTIPTALQEQFSQLEFRVGKIVEVKCHPDAEMLYVEQIDCGEDKPREIVSGLVKYIPEEKMLNSYVIVFANLKPNKIRGIMSNGMVLCAVDRAKDAVELVMPPSGSVPGDLISIEGAQIPDNFPKINLKKKTNAWKDCSTFLKTNNIGIAQFNGLPLICGSKGACKVETVINGTIS